MIYPCVFYLTQFPHVSTTSDRVAIAVHPSIAVANHPGAPNQAWPRAPGIAVDRLACYADSVMSGWPMDQNPGTRVKPIQ